MAIAYVGLGANVGDRRAQLAWAVQRLHASPDLRVQRVSALREYPPVGGPPQPPYLNAVAEVITTLAPLDLLRRL
ncbi:MAG: 2-amino-4-hydroxy-6-hydroxymethyldihydropteridine diphosphokinase, partial [Candidatus Omnitrophica bacterium]|nr:2-amino-4-hydroxy-6-hydroxymethyldihydropteridine diphosphokinase [Candidatus Omnitrophota bacterium]